MDNSNVTPLHPKEKSKTEEGSLVSSLSPREIVSELDRFVVGQNKAKKAVAVALRNRWRRQVLKGEMKNEVLPKNILMIGPTGVGKTEISRRLSKLAEAPFVKVEATRFTEVGYVGRDVEQIVRDLIEIAIAMEKVKKRKEVFTQAQKAAEEKVLDALVGKKASLATRESFRKRLRNGDLDDNEIEISVLPTPVGPIIRIFFGKTSFFISPLSACLRHLFLKATATAFFALFWPTTNLSNSETISLGDKELTNELSSLSFLSFGTRGVTFEFSIKFLKL